MNTAAMTSSASTVATQNDAGAATAATPPSAAVVAAAARRLSSIGVARRFSTSSGSGRPATISDYDDRSDTAWIFSFAAAMAPFTAFCFSHARGWTARTVENVARSRIGVYGLLLLPFCTLAAEKCIYDTVQSVQGIDPKLCPKDRGGFPSGGAEFFPSFSLVPVWKPQKQQQQQQQDD